MLPVVKFQTIVAGWDERLRVADYLSSALQDHGQA